MSSNEKSLAKNSFYNILYNVANVLLPLLTSIYVSRILMPAGVGKVAYANNFVAYFVTVAALGLPTYGISAISRSKYDTDEKNRTFSELFFVNAISTSACIIVFFCVLYCNSASKQDIALYLCCGIQLFLCYFNIDWLYKGQEDYAYITKRNIIVKVLALLCLPIIVRNSEDYLQYALITSCALGVNYFFNIINSRKYVKLMFRGLRPKRHIKSLLFLTISLICSTIYSRIDVTMLGIMIDDTSVGIYTNGHKIIELVITACISITAVFLPRMSYLYDKNKNEFIKLINNGIRIIMFITIPATVGLALLSTNAAVLLYGEEFAATGTVLMCFSPLIIIKGFGDLLCYQTIISIGKENKLVFAAIAAMLINVMLNALLIPSQREIGATVASVSSEFVVNVILFVYVQKRIPLTIRAIELLKTVMASLGMGVVVWLIKNCGLSNLLVCGIGITVGCIVYVLIGFLLKNQMIFDVIGILKRTQK